MSETTEQKPTEAVVAPDAPLAVNPMTEEGARPWHGTDNPLEAMWLHFTAEIAKLKHGKTVTTYSDEGTAPVGDSALSTTSSSLSPPPNAS